MKLSKSKLKQIIKETLEEEFDPETPRGEQWWVTEMRQVVESADKLYKTMPPVGKRFLTKNFEMYVKEWKKEEAGYPEAEDLSVGPEEEKEI
jgi:hypothetical protein